MLLQFVIENVLSFRDEALLRLHRTQEPVQVTAIYGANASGKSNLIKALRALRQLIVHGDRRPPAAKPFGLDAKRSEPMRFEVVVRIDGNLYEYHLAIRGRRIEGEELYLNDRLMFERDAGGIRRHTNIEKDAGYFDYVVRGTGPEQPFLTEAAMRGLRGPVEIRRWFQGYVHVLRSSGARPAVAQALAKHENLRTFVEQTLSEWQTGVSGVEVSVDAELDPSDGEPKLRLRHEGADALSSLELSAESDGTRRLLEVLPMLYRDHRLSPSPRVGELFVIDELDRSLHPALSARFVRTFRERRPHDQLLFTSHDTALLTQAIHSPEELWFVEKDKRGASSVYGLAEFEPEQVRALMAELDRGYLNGRFGAVPFAVGATQGEWLGRSRS